MTNCNPLKVENKRKTKTKEAKRKITTYNIYSLEERVLKYIHFNILLKLIFAVKKYRTEDKNSSTYPYLRISNNRLGNFEQPRQYVLDIFSLFNFN